MKKLSLSKLISIVFSFCIGTVIASPAQTFSTLLNFDGAGGASPLYGYPIQATDTNVYGTTSAGGTYNQGTIFKITSEGTLTTLYAFCTKTNCTDGAEPYAGLVQGDDGNFYGTTEAGGTHAEGTVFKITSAGKLITLHSFAGAPTDGASPFSGLVEFGGNFYGTTSQGGANGQGTVFEITSAGKLTIVYSFCTQANCTDGAQPFAGLLQVSGNFYGTTRFGGGASNAGTVFQITPAGQLTRLYSFCEQVNCVDGDVPSGGLVQAINGNLYGTTVNQGAHGFGGTVFEISLGGQLTTLYSFCAKANCTDGYAPVGGLVQGTNGVLYGTTLNGGTKGLAGFGTVFKITTAGKLTTLHNFNLTNGAHPYGGLVQASNGDLYGATSFGGNRYDGTIFSLSFAK